MHNMQISHLIIKAKQWKMQQQQKLHQIKTCVSCCRESSCSVQCRWSLLPWVTTCSQNGAKELAGAWPSPPWPSSPATWSTCSSPSKAHTKRWEQHCTSIKQWFSTPMQHWSSGFLHNVALSYECNQVFSTKFQDSDWNTTTKSARANTMATLSHNLWVSERLALLLHSVLLNFNLHLTARQARR